jgi:transcription elongation factor/antiterminator RfaH
MVMQTPAPQAAAARWYAVKSQPRREHHAALCLRKQDFPAFLPCHRRSRRHARKIDTVLAPLFPGYLFVSLDLARDRWRSVNGTRGVCGLVMQGERPAPVPRGIVEALNQRCDAQGVLTAFEELKTGQSVRIIAGAFADFIGELDRQDSVGRIRVLLDIMGGRIPVALSRADVISARLPA